MSKSTLPPLALVTLSTTSSSYDHAHAHHGAEEFVAVVVVLSVFLASLLCLALCLRRPPARQTATAPDFDNLQDWVCQFDEANKVDLERGGGRAATGDSDISSEWQQVTVESIFPDLLSKKKKKGLAEPFLPSS
eukprot:CAMPEP_0172448600 /NCGR_PEP_ID=MMETSP1065-20121228/7579_1 /TAXON_ID=265537 /ORGANISM="Amphiprora paludosa, Strain CCMP125" /LENGTH=133 /DNA_ID=CAMNT_0013200149 /DNA_START=142 /DNA_END=543 /DNA_ORIENTATION=+